DLRTDGIQRLVQPVGLLAEVGYFRRPDVGGHHRRVLRVARDLAAYVPELLQVVMLRPLGGFHAERRVAAGPATALDVVLALDLLGQREEAPEDVVAAGDLLLADAVAADPGKAPLAVGVTQLGHEGLAVDLAGRV